MQETAVQSLGWEDPLEKEMATQSSILAWKIPWTEEPGGLQPMGLQRVAHDLAAEQPQPHHRFGSQMPLTLVLQMRGLMFREVAQLA